MWVNVFPTASHSLFVPLSSELRATCIIIRILLQCMPYPLKCSIYIALIYRLQIISLSPTRLTFSPWKTLMQVFFQENSVNTGIEAQLSLCYWPRLLLLQKWVSYSSSVSPNFRELSSPKNLLIDPLFLYSTLLTILYLWSEWEEASNRGSMKVWNWFQELFMKNLHMKVYL